MKFTITTSGYFYPEKERRAELEKIGFKFKSSSYKDFKILGEPTVEIKDLDELIEFADKWGEIIVGDGTIEIYDADR